MGPSIYDYANREDYARYRELRNQQIETYEPVGAAEELEVERIAACWWRLGRAWRCENAEIARGHAAVAVRQLRRMDYTPDERWRLSWLKKAKSEVESTGELSDEFQKKMFLGNRKFRKHWEFLSEVLKERSAEFLVSLGIRRSRAEQFAKDPTCLRLLTVDVAIRLIQDQVEERSHGAQISLEPASDLMAVLSAEPQDRVLRAEAAAERSLQRAIDRLERLQRRRLGEAFPPSVSVRLTR
jgi:hypothetical protein